MHSTGTARAVIEAIEGMELASAYLENDEQGRLRLVKIERRESEADGAPALAPPRKRLDELDRIELEAARAQAIEGVRILLRAYATAVRQCGIRIAKVAAALDGGIIERELANRLTSEAYENEREALKLVEEALGGLFDEAAILERTTGEQ
jgi:hypothetical protein